MKGLDLRSFRSDLHKVEPDSEEPSLMITDWEEKLSPWKERISEWRDWPFDFRAKYYELPLEVLAGFSFDELCKLHYSSRIMMDKTVTDLFEESAQHEIVQKIGNSMWRWSFSMGTWNEVVDAYNGIRSFAFIDNPDFELRLDRATHNNEFGYAKYSRTYIDGAFAFLVHYKQKHVLTIGFSILEGRRILIQQVQAVQRSGNRFFFKLPKNRIEFAIDLFRRNFPGYRLFIIDGESLTKKILADYQKGLERRQESLRAPHLSQEYLKRLKRESEEFEVMIAHLEADMSRLAVAYRDVGRHRLGSRPFTALNLVHHPILVRMKSQPASRVSA